MTAVLESSTDLVDPLRHALDGLLDLDPSMLSGEHLLELTRTVEAQARRTAAVQHRLVGELERRNVAGEAGYRSTGAFLSQLLNLTRRHAADRVEAAARFGPRHALTGEGLEPLFPAAAAALAERVLSIEQATVIAATVHALPEPLRAAHRASIDVTLTALGGDLDPTGLKIAGERILGYLHPDGTLTEDRIHRRDRKADMHRHPDGSGQLTAHLSPACYALWETVLEPLARKRPDTGHGPDDRNDGQRLHDALEDAARRLLRTGELPTTVGVATTLMVTMTLDQLEARAGQATTAHGGTISIAEALRLAAGAKALPVVLGGGGILAYGRARRLASPAQRLALMARDKGCTFPDCRETAARSEVHHITDWAKGGENEPRPTRTRLRLRHQRTPAPRLESSHDQRHPALDSARHHRPRTKTPPQPSPPQLAQNSSCKSGWASDNAAARACSAPGASSAA
jgi:hypothetical protein